ncbi:MAG: LuxR C-terminal-related transcriptional regulator [Balneolaceae bacterium]
MKWIQKNVNYLREDQLQVSDPQKEIDRALESIKSFKPIGNQFVYVASYFTDDFSMPYISPGVRHVLGYDPEEVKNLSFFYGRIHPDDLESVKKLTANAINALSGKSRIKLHDHVFHLTYRMKHKGGSYVHVQRQTGLLTRDANHNMLTSFGIYTDVTHLTNSSDVHSMMSGPEIPGFNFNAPGAGSKTGFTRREKEIIEELAMGLNSKEIADKLFITKKTVDTHRRNMLRKAGVKNSTGLIAYAFKNGF